MVTLAHFLIQLFQLAPEIRGLVGVQLHPARLGEDLGSFGRSHHLATASNVLVCVLAPRSDFVDDGRALDVTRQLARLRDQRLVL